MEHSHFEKLKVISILPLIIYTLYIIRKLAASKICFWNQHHICPVLVLSVTGEWDTLINYLINSYLWKVNIWKIKQYVSCFVSNKACPLKLFSFLWNCLSMPLNSGTYDFSSTASFVFHSVGVLWLTMCNLS